MLIRRFGQNRRIFGIATLAIAFLFCVYLYYDLLNQLKLNDERNQRLKALQNSLSTQLQVVYEHKSRLERTIQDEKDHHHKTKEAKQDLEIKLNREKQELQNRLLSVSQKQQMMQTQFEDLQKEMSKSEADFQLLKSDYQKEVEEYKERIFIQSQKCDKDRKYLSEEMDDLKQSQKEISNSLTQCQDAVKNLQRQIHDLKMEPVLHNLADNLNKLSFQGNQSHDSLVHINPNLVPSALIKDTAFVENKGQDKDENDDKKVALAFQSEDDVVNNPIPVQSNRTVRQQKEEDEDRQLQAAPPPRALTQNHQQLIQEAEAPNENGHFDRGFRNRAKDAIIEAPNDPEEKELPDKNLNEDEDQEEVEEKNGQNEADQKDDDDYQYDKNVDDEEKNDEKDDFPDAILANKNLNKIQNPVYPDDVEVANH